MASPLEDAQESMETSPQNNPDCYFLQQDFNFEENPHPGFASTVGVGAISEENQEMIDSLSDNGSITCSITDFLAEKCDDSREMLIGTDSKISPAKDGREIGEGGSVKKLESSDFQPNCEIEENREMGFAVSVDNQEKIDSFCGKGSISASSLGFSGNEGQETIESSKDDSVLHPGCKIDENHDEMGFGIDSGIGSISEGNQEIVDSLCETSLSRVSAVKVETSGKPVHGGDDNRVGFGDIVERKMDFSEIGASGKDSAIGIAVKEQNFLKVEKKRNDGGKVLVNPSLKIEVIDDTALIETVLLRKTGNVCGKQIGMAASAKIAEKRCKQEFYGAKAKSLRRKPMYVKKISQFAAKKKYSREEMEKLRFVNLVEQRKLWRDVHTGLGAAVMREYNDLVISKQQQSMNTNVDHHQRSRRVGGHPSVLGVFTAWEPRNDLNIFVHRGMAQCNLQRTNCNQFTAALP